MMGRFLLQLIMVGIFTFPLFLNVLFIPPPNDKVPLNDSYALVSTTDEDCNIISELKNILNIPSNGQYEIECSELVVPAYHNQSSGKEYTLPVKTIRRQNGLNHEALIYLHGGPGGTVIRDVDKLMFINSRLFEERDIVLIGQRGTVTAKPSLTCEKEFAISGSNIYNEPGIEERRIRDCHERLLNNNIDLASFNSRENAGDIEALRRELVEKKGYQKVSLYGISYGTTLALHVVNRYPNGWNSIILDGAAPIQTNFLVEMAKSNHNALNELFTACKTTLACNQSFPDLENRFYDLIQELNQKPVILKSTTNRKYSIRINGDLFYNGFISLMKSGSNIGYLPWTIYNAKNDLNNFWKPYDEVYFDHSFSTGGYYSTLCAENNNFSYSDISLTGVNSEIERISKESLTQFKKICSFWKVDDISHDTDSSIRSDIPTLILSGRFDPLTPPGFGDVAARSLSNSVRLVIPSGSHGSITNQDSITNCVVFKINEFLKNPDEFLAKYDKTAQNEICNSENERLIFYCYRTILSPSLKPCVRGNAPVLIPTPDLPKIINAPDLPQLIKDIIDQTNIDKAIEKLIEDQKRQFEDDLNKALEEWAKRQREILIRMLEKQIERSINEQCGTAYLPIAAIVIFYAVGKGRRKIRGSTTRLDNIDKKH